MSKIKKITKRSATSVFRQSSPAANSTALINSLNNLSSDVGEIISEFAKVQAILNGLLHGSEDSIVGLNPALDSTTVGLDGTVTLTERASTSSAPEYIFSRTLNRPLSVKESIVEAYTSLKESIDSIIIEVPDVVSDYTKEYIGEKAFNSSASSSSTSIDGRLSALESEVDAIVIPTLDLDAVKLFVGMDDLDTPKYTNHNTVTIVSDGDSLEKAIALLDYEITNLPSHAAAAVLFGDGTNVPATDATNFVWDNALNRLGIGNAAPQAELHVTGKVLMTTGVQSYGGNARGANAIDLQTIRALVDQVASGAGSFIGGGRDNKVTGDYAGAVGDGNNVQNVGGFAIGEKNEVNANYGFAHGRAARSGYQGSHAHANGSFSGPGDSQCETVIVRNTTVNATPAELFVDGGGTPIVLRDNSGYTVDLKVIGRSQTNNVAGYAFRFVIKRGVGAGTVALVGAVTKEVLGEDVAGWDAAVTADTVDGSIQITVTGYINNNIRWTGTAQLTQASW
jgi:hypothetical protein